MARPPHAFGGSAGLLRPRRLGSPSRPARTPAGSSRVRPPTPSTRPATRPLPDSRSSPPRARASRAVRHWHAADFPLLASSPPHSSHDGSARRCTTAAQSSPAHTASAPAGAGPGVAAPSAHTAGTATVRRGRAGPARLSRPPPRLPTALATPAALAPAPPSRAAPAGHHGRPRTNSPDSPPTPSRLLRSARGSLASSSGRPLGRRCCYHRRPFLCTRHRTPLTRSTEMSHTPPRRRVDTFRGRWYDPAGQPGEGLAPRRGRALR